jgi:hypothetical protein
MDGFDVNDPTVKAIMLGTSTALLVAVGASKLLIDYVRRSRARAEQRRRPRPDIVHYVNPLPPVAIPVANANGSGKKVRRRNGRGKCNSKPVVSEPVATTEPAMMTNPMRTSSRVMTHEELAQPHRSMIGVVQKDQFGRKFMILPNPNFEKDPEKLKRYKEQYDAGDYSNIYKMSATVRQFLKDDSSSGEESSSEEEAPPRPPSRRKAPPPSRSKAPPPAPPMLPPSSPPPSQTYGPSIPHLLSARYRKR